MLAAHDGRLWIGTQAGMMRLSRTPVRVLALPTAADSDFGTVALDTDHPEQTARASIDFVKKPYFYRTPWFVALCVLFLSLASILAYQVRMKQIHGRFKAVLAERTRLAREMHDSRLHLIDYAATQIRATVDEARQAVWNLLGEEHTLADLDTAMQRMADRISREHDVKMLYRQTGKPL